MAISPTKSRVGSGSQSPSRGPFCSLASSLNSVSLNNSPVKALSLRETIHKSGAKKGTLLSAAAVAAMGGGATKKRNGSPVKTFTREDLTGENRSPGKGKGGMAAGGGFGRMDVVGIDRDNRVETGRKSPTKKGKHVRRSSLAHVLALTQR